jgi:hypothetical protein
MSMKRLSRDEAFLLAVNIAKLPSVPRQILKDIPRPPNSASRDDCVRKSTRRLTPENTGEPVAVPTDAKGGGYRLLESRYFYISHYLFR